jgi:hypothetical protein
MCATEQGRGKEARALAGRPTLERINDVGERAYLRDNRWNYAELVARAGAPHHSNSQARGYCPGTSARGEAALMVRPPIG